jgi:hypothetical protein
MTDFDTERFTLRQAAQARDDFAQIMDELDFVKAQLSRLPTRRDQAFTPLRIMVWVGSPQRRACDRLDRTILAPLPLREGAGVPCGCPGRVAADQARPFR